MFSHSPTHSLTATCMFSHCSVRQRWNWIPEQKTEAKVRVWVCEGERVERSDCVWAGLKVMFFCHIPHFSLFLFLPLPSPPSPSLSHLPSLLLFPSSLPPPSFPLFTGPAAQEGWSNHHGLYRWWDDLLRDESSLRSCPIFLIRSRHR